MGEKTLLAAAFRSVTRAQESVVSSQPLVVQMGIVVLSFYTVAPLVDPNTRTWGASIPMARTANMQTSHFILALFFSLGQPTFVVSGFFAAPVDWQALGLYDYPKLVPYPMDQPSWRAHDDRRRTTRRFDERGRMRDITKSSVRASDIRDALSLLQRKVEGLDRRANILSDDHVADAYKRLSHLDEDASRRVKDHIQLYQQIIVALQSERCVHEIEREDLECELAQIFADT